jgi:hypothetical protein
LKLKYAAILKRISKTVDLYMDHLQAQETDGEMII